MDIKKIIEEKCNIVVDSIKLIGEGYDSKAYIVNNEYVFKIKFSANKKKGYEKEKAIYDFLNKKLNTNIKIPKLVMQLTQPDTRCRICLHERQGVSRYVR